MCGKSKKNAETSKDLCGNIIQHAEMSFKAVKYSVACVLPCIGVGVSVVVISGISTMNKTCC